MNIELLKQPDMQPALSQPFFEQSQKLLQDSLSDATAIY